MELYDVENSYGQTKDKDHVLKNYQQILAEKGNDTLGESLVMLAAKFAHPEALEFLQNEGVDLNVIGRYEFTPLHELAKLDTRYYIPKIEDIRRCVHLLLDSGVSVLKKDENEYMACYHYAARSANYAFVEELHGKKLDMTNRDGFNGIHIACDYVRHQISSVYYANEHLNSALRLNENEERITTSRNKLETEKKKLDDYFKTVAAFVDGGVDKDEKNNYGQTGLDLAVKAEAKKIATYLSGEDIHDEDSAIIGGMTLHQAVEKNDREAVLALVRRGADVNAIYEIGEYKDYHGYTPLSIACSLLHSDLVATLLDCQADPNFKDNQAHTALYYIGRHASIRQQETEIQTIFKTFMNHGLLINDFVDDDSNTLLNYFCQQEKDFLIKMLLKFKCDVNLANRFGVTPLMHVCKGFFTTMESIQLLLLEANADVSASDAKGNTVLHYAASNRSDSGAKVMCDMLFEFCQVDVNAVNNQGQSALDIATINNNEPLVKLLLSKM